MSSNSIYTKSWAGLDKGVWLSMIIMMVLSAGLLSYKLATNKECTPVNFTIKSMDSRGAIYTAGEIVTFNAGTDNPEISWNFGDNSNLAKGGYVTHKFEKEGNYSITAYNKSGCESSQLLTIRKQVITNNTATNNITTGEEIVGPSNTTVGIEELFSCMVSAKTYEWSIVNYPKLTRTGMAAKFPFPHAGKFTVQVTIDGDRSKRFTKEVLVENAAIVKSSQPAQKLVPLIPADLAVLPKENKTVSEPVATPVENVPAAPAGPKRVIISDAAFISYLDKISSHEMSIADFDKYLCGGGTTKVVVNGNTKDMKTFSWLYQELGERKAPKIETASLNRADNCVTLILVKFKKKKGFLGL